MNNKREFPCKECLTFSICKSQFNQEKVAPSNKMLFATRQFHAFSFIIHKCSIMKDIVRDKKFPALDIMIEIEEIFS